MFSPNAVVELHCDGFDANGARHADGGVAEAVVDDEADASSSLDESVIADHFVVVDDDGV